MRSIRVDPPLEQLGGLRCHSIPSRSAGYSDLPRLAQSTLLFLQEGPHVSNEVTQGARPFFLPPGPKKCSLRRVLGYVK